MPKRIPDDIFISLDKDGFKMKEKKEKKQKTKLQEPKAGCKVLAVFLCIIMVPVMLYLYFAAQTKYYLSPGGIDLFLEKTGYIDETFDDFFYEAFYIDEVSYYLSEDELQECRDMYEETMHNAVRFCLTGEGDVVDVDAFMEFAKSNKNLLEDAYEYELEAEDFEYLQEDLEYLNEYMTEYYADEIDYLDEPAASIVKNLSRIISAAYLILAAAYILFVFVIMMVLFRKRQDKVYIYMSVSTIVSSVYMLLFAGFLKALAVFSESGEGLLDFYLEDTLLSSTNLIANNALAIAGIVLAAGIALNVIGHVIRGKKKKELSLGENV